MSLLTAVGRLAAEQTGKRNCVITATMPRGKRTSAPKPSCRLFSIASLEDTASGFRCLAKNNHTAKHKTKTRWAVNGQRSTVSSQRSAVNGQSAVSSQQSVANGQQSMASSQWPAVNDQQSTASSQRPAANDQQPTVSSQRLAVNGQQSTVSVQRSAFIGQRAPTDNRRLL